MEFYIPFYNTVKMQRYFRKDPPKQIDHYEEFQKAIYEDMVREWRIYKLSYIIRFHTLQSILQKVPGLTTEKIRKDFEKCPIVKETCMSLGQVIILPK